MSETEFSAYKAFFDTVTDTLLSDQTDSEKVLKICMLAQISIEIIATNGDCLERGPDALYNKLFSETSLIGMQG